MPVAAPPESVAESVFAARRITKTYHMGEVDVQALRGVDLDLYAGEFVVLLGPSGSGKSTLLNILGGLDVPTDGSVFYRGEQLTAFDDNALTRYRRDNVGFVFQFYNLIPSLTARENVALITEIAQNPMKPAEALGLVGLGKRMDHFPAQMSGGEQHVWPSREPSPSGRTCSCATSRQARSTSTPACWCSKQFRRSIPRWGRRPR